MVSCNSQLDITPKGETTLDNLTDLECLLNNNFAIGNPMKDLGVICNESYGSAQNVPLALAKTSTNEYAWLHTMLKWIVQILHQKIPDIVRPTSISII